MAESTPANEVSRTVLDILQRTGQRFVAQMQREHLSGPTGPTSLSVRTGALRRSLTQTVTAQGDGAALDVSVGSFTAAYARIHEYGGIIRPIRSKYLAIPIGKALTRAGVARFSPRNFPGELHFIRSRKGNKLLVQFIGKGKRRRMEPMFVLKESVTIPARMNFRRTFQQNASRCLEEVRLAVKVLAVPQVRQLRFRKRR